MKKILTFFAAMLIGITAINAEDLYLRGGVNGWNASNDYKFADNGDGTFTLNKTFDLEGEFKFADANWGSVLNFGSSEKATCSEQGVTINLVTNGTNISTDGKLSLTKIVVDKNQKKATFFGTKGTASDGVYTIAGQSALVGVEWDPTATINDMTDMKDGTYQLVKEDISLAAGNYDYKAVKNHTWGIWECPSGNNNNTLTISEAGTYTVTFTLTPATSTLVANAVKSGEPQPIETKYYITGNAALCGEKAWNAQAIEMDDSTHTFTAMAAGEYEMKITNGAWEPAGQSWGSAALSEECSAGVGDKDGNIHFIVETPNNVVVSIANGSVTVTGTFKQEEPVKQDYYLVGYINGANIGCEEDYESLYEEYKFVDGTLTTTFTETSYVFVKTSDNSHWYLANEYVAPAAKVDAILAEGNTQKVGVNGNIEVTFTLTENADGTVTLSYKEPVITYADSVYYVAGNFTKWAEGMLALPASVELPADSALEFKQVLTRTVLADGDSVRQDTTWYGQANEGNKMTRESSAWTLDGEYNVLATTDIAGTYTFSLNEKGEFVLGWPKEPVITYADSVYYVAGNFTKWAEGMLALPASVELPADSALEFKEVLLRTILADGDSVGQDTTWYGQANEGNKMTRESSTWTLDGEYNVLATTDIEGTYTFSLNEKGEFVLGWPEKPLPEVKYYAKNNWDGGEWSWLEMSATNKENIYMLDSVVFGGGENAGININSKADDADAKWFDVDHIVVLDDGHGTDTVIPSRPPHIRVAAEEEPQPLKLQAGDTIMLVFNASDTTLYAGIYGRPTPPEPAKTFDLTVVQDTMWSKDGAKIAAWIWGDDLEGQWTAWATNVNDTLTLKVNEKADSIILVRCADDAEVPSWTPWNRIDAGEIEDCHLFIITDWNEGVWCEREQPVEHKFYVTGNAALVGEEKAWQADAIEMVDDTHTFPMLAAGEYQLKVTDGTWAHSWGYDNLSPTVAVEGLYTDVDGNICFTVYTPNDVTVTFAQGYVIMTGDFKGTGTNLNKVKAAQGQRFNVLGLPVNANYRGVVIMNGQTYLQ